MEGDGHSLVNSVARGLRRLHHLHQLRRALVRKTNRIYAAKELKQNLKHCKQLRKLYLQTEKVKKKKLQAINQISLS
jgi:hypothetical protein